MLGHRGIEQQRLHLVSSNSQILSMKCCQKFLNRYQVENFSVVKYPSLSIRFQSFLGIIIIRLKKKN